MTLCPPHDITDKKITEYLPKGEYADELLAIMKRSQELLKNHPVNQSRIERGLNPVSSVWFWGEGRKPLLDEFYALRGLKGACISAVDLIKGIGICAGMTTPEVNSLKASGYNPLADDTPDSVFCTHGAGFTVPWNEVKNYMHMSHEEFLP